MVNITSSGISNQLRNMYSICRCCWNIATYRWKVHNGKIEIIFFFCKVSFLTDPHCRFRGVVQGMKLIQLYLWYLLFQNQWYRYDKQNHQTQNYLVKCISESEIKRSSQLLFVFLQRSHTNNIIESSFFANHVITYWAKHTSLCSTFHMPTSNICFVQKKCQYYAIATTIVW